MPPTIPNSSNTHISNALILSDPLLTTSLKDLPTDLSIPKVLAQAKRLGTFPAVTSALSSTPLASALPPSALQQPTHTLARNILALEVADDVAHALHTASIRTIALKGLSLLHTLYRDRIDRRGMSDIDLLIDAATFPKAIRVLQNLGWVLKSTPPATSRLNVEAVFHRPPQGHLPQLTLELHRRLTFPGRFSPPHALLWRSATPIPDSPLLQLAPHHAVLYLAAHKALHVWCNDIRDLFDTANIIQHASLNETFWDDLLHAAPQWSATRALWLLLHRVQTHMHPNLTPQHILTRLRPPEPIARFLLAQTPDLLADPTLQTGLPHTLPHTLRVPLLLSIADTPLSHIAAFATIALRSSLDRPFQHLPPQTLDLLHHIPFPAAS